MRAQIAEIPCIFPADQGILKRGDWFAADCTIRQRVTASRCPAAACKRRLFRLGGTTGQAPLPHLRGLSTQYAEIAQAISYPRLSYGLGHVQLLKASTGPPIYVAFCGYGQSGIVVNSRPVGLLVFKIPRARFELSGRQ